MARLVALGRLAGSAPAGRSVALRHRVGLARPRRTLWRRDAPHRLIALITSTAAVTGGPRRTLPAARTGGSSTGTAAGGPSTAARRTGTGTAARRTGTGTGTAARRTGTGTAVAGRAIRPVRALLGIAAVAWLGPGRRRRRVVHRAPSLGFAEAVVGVSGVSGDAGRCGAGSARRPGSVAAAGSSTTNVAPPPLVWRTPTRPECAVTMAITMARPRPLPPEVRPREGSPRWNRWKTLSMSPAGMPGPASRISSRTPSPTRAPTGAGPTATSTGVPRRRVLQRVGDEVGHDLAQPVLVAVDDRGSRAAGRRARASRIGPLRRRGPGRPGRRPRRAR